MLLPLRSERIPLPIRTSILAPCLLSSIWFLMVLLVNPIGDFPLHDDWAFGWSVRTLLDTREFRLSDWNATNSLPQIFFGALFCLPFGFSFTILRLLTLGLGLLGVLVSYGLLRQIGSGFDLAFLGALLIAINPLYFNLANSFMTDVPSFTIFMLSLFCLISGLHNQSNLAIGLGLFLSCVAVLERQSNLIIIPAFSLAYLNLKGLRSRTIGHVLLFNAIVFAVYVAYPQMLKLTGRTPFLYNLQINQLIASAKEGIPHVSRTVIHNVAIVAIYFGLFMLPFLIIISASQYRNLSARQRRFAVWPAAVVVLAAAVFAALHHPMPLAGNILNFANLGGQDIPGYDSILHPSTRTALSRMWQGLTVLGVVGAVLLTILALWSLLRSFYDHRRTDDIFMAGYQEQQWKIILPGGLLIMYCLPICILEKQYWFDRYLILCLPLVMMLVTTSICVGKRKSVGMTMVGVVAALVLSYAGATVVETHDYLASNRARWQAIYYAMRDLQISPSQINGGFEFEGWYFGNSLATCNPGKAAISQSSDVAFSTFTCLDDNSRREYLISYALQTGYIIQTQYSFRRWLPWREQSLYLLHRIPVVPRG